ncbi:hypothetical protein NUITMVR1_27970 [Raoultella ornithinolytica]|nr:hypothetical protein NUITMVR1_27970 [Raoultella ornithinolytica]
MTGAVNENKRYENVSYHETERTAKKAASPNNASGNIWRPAIRL